MSILDTAEYRRLALIAAGVDPCDIPCILDTAAWRRLMLKALYDLSQGGGGSPGYINGSVQFYTDLPVTVGTPAVNTAYLVRENSGVWFINRKPAGIYVRLFNNGNLNDWDYAGTFPEVNDAQYFRIYDSADPTREVAFNVSGVAAATTRTLTVPNASGTLGWLQSVSSITVSTTHQLTAARNQRVRVNSTNIGSGAALYLPSTGNAEGDRLEVACVGLTAGTLGVRTGQNDYTVSASMGLNEQRTFIYTSGAWTLGSVESHTHSGLGPTFASSAFQVTEPSGLVTNRLAFSLSGITAGATRTLTVPNASGTLALTTTPPALHASTHAIAVHASFTGVVAGMGTTAVIRADNGGTIGNSVVLTFNGLAELFTVISDWNSNNPSNTITLVSGNTADVPDNGETITLTGGINGGSDVVTPASIGAAVIGTGADNAQGAQRGVLTKGNFEAFEINEFNNAIFKTSNTGDGCIGIETYTGAARTGFCLLGSRGANAFMQGGSSTFRIEKSGGTLADLNASRVVAASGTLTASAPVLDLAQTWNGAGVEFTGIRFNATSTNSATTSSLLRLDVGGSSIYNFTRSGQINVGANITLVPSSGSCLIFGALQVGQTDTVLVRDAADTLAQRRATNPQTFRLYNTFTDANNHERGFMRWSSNVFQIGTEKGTGGGLARALQFQVDGTTRFSISAAGALSLGSVVTVWENTAGVYISNNGASINFNNALGISVNEGFIAGSGGRFRWKDNVLHTGGSYDLGFQRNSAGVLEINNGTTGNFRDVVVRMLDVGGTTNAFPALKNSSTTLQVRLADDTAFAPFACAGLTLNGDLTASTRNIVTDITTGTKIGTATDQKIGFFNATPVVQQAAVADATDAASTQARLNDLLARLRTLGLIAT